jgi:hypothetical protein
MEIFPWVMHLMVATYLNRNKELRLSKLLTIPANHGHPKSLHRWVLHGITYIDGIFL